MRQIQLLLLTALLLLPAALPAARGEYQVIGGEIRSIETFNYVNRPTPHVHILLETKRGEILVDLGPKWYLRAQGINLQAMKSVQIEGILRTIDGTQILEAIRLNQDNQTYRFRTNSGAPLWSKRDTTLENQGD